MMYSVDMLDKVLADEQSQTPDPSVTPDTNILDLQAIVARLDRLEQTVSTLRQGTNDSGAADNDLNSGAADNDDSKGDGNNES